MTRTLLLAFALALLSLASVAQTSTPKTPDAAVPPVQEAKPATQEEAPKTSEGTSPKGFVLEDGTPVKLRINRTISSADARVGETIDFEVLEESASIMYLLLPRAELHLQPKLRRRRSGGWLAAERSTSMSIPCVWSRVRKRLCAPSRKSKVEATPGQ